ncbi:5-methylthioadenosine/S-adenosylhomocysteine deaminase [Mycobacterium sp. MAA66]|uniref:amidohydrolase family protein n=1 Tax=Mycobacterium sp. MAA66 TaxID=3156297 RepID=UPI003517B40E
MTKTLFKDGAILSMDPSVGDFRRGDVLVEDGVITHVGDSVGETGCDVVDASDAIIMPGLIDAHRHLWYSGVRGTGMDEAAGEALAAWSKLGPAFTPDVLYAFTRAGIANALESGVTTVFDWCHVINTPELAEAAVQAHLDMPMRAVFAYGASMRQKLDEFAGKFGSASWDHAAQLRRQYFSSDDKRLTFALALQGLDFTTLEITRDDIAAARAMGVPMSFHTGVALGPAKESIKRLAEEGLLGSDMSFVHCCTTTDEEFRLLAEHDGRAVSCPAVDAALNFGASPSERMRKNGLAPCFGADAIATASGDLFEEARVGLFLERNDYGHARHLNGDVVMTHGDRISAREALAAVTSVAARNCWLEDHVGSLTPGKRADLILLRASDSNLWPLGNLLSAVVSAANRGNVDAVMVDGKFVKRGGRLVDIDTASIRTDLVRARDSLYAASGYDDIEPKLAG